MPIYLIVLLCLLNHSCFSGSRMVLSLYALELGANQFTIGILVSAFAFVLFPFFANPWLLAMAAFILGLGVGCGQPMSMSLIYALAPAGRTSEAAGLRVMVNNVAHLFIPLFSAASARRSALRPCSCRMRRCWWRVGNFYGGRIRRKAGRTG